MAGQGVRDGHTGLDAEIVMEGGPDDIPVKLSRLKHATGDVDWVLHVREPRMRRSYLGVLNRLGLQRFPHKCQVVDGTCHYKIVGDFHPDKFKKVEPPRVHGQLAHGFNTFAENVDRLMTLLGEVSDLAGAVRLSFAGPQAMPDTIRVTNASEAVPQWVDELKLDRTKQLEETQASVRAELSTLVQLSQLLYGTGDDLEDAVVVALKILGLDATRNEEGANMDIAASAMDGRQFGVEVTGIMGQLKKQSVKITQLMKFEQDKVGNEKGMLVLVANRTTAPAVRRDQPAITGDALSFLGRQPCALVLGETLYEMVKDVIEKRKTAAEQVELLWAAQGLLDYGTA